MEMDLNTVWFILITVLFTGFFILEGFDYGVGILLPFVSDHDKERSMMLRTITPVWDGNEVWMLTAGGAMFAAFPHVYATMFSGMYLALFLMLLALIIRGLGFEYRHRLDGAATGFWDCCIFLGSFLPAVLWGVAVANLLAGLPIDGTMTYYGGLSGLISPVTLMGGIAFLLVFMFHGAAYLTIRLAKEGMILTIRKKATSIGIGAAICYVIFLANVVSKVTYDMGAGLLIFGLAAVSFVAGLLMMFKKVYGLSFICSTLAILFTTVGTFVSLFPNIMFSTISPDYSLTIYNACSTPYTLGIMTTAAAVFVPIVLLYQGWVYWHFRHPVSDADVRGNH